MSSRFVTLGNLHTEHHNWKNPRTVTGLDDKAIAALAADIKEVRDQSEDPKKASGFLSPITVVQVKQPTGDVVDLSVDGQRRVLAAEYLKLPKTTLIEVVDLTGWNEPVDLTPDKADELTSVVMRMFNREGLSSFEVSEIAQGMRNRGKQLAEIAAKIHRSESWVSRILKARSAASPKLMLAWQKGEITDEQFKDLAAQRDTEAQAKNTDEVIEARKSGNQAEARTKAKEVVETAKQKRAREKAEAEAKAKADREAKAKAKADAKAAKSAAKSKGAAPAAKQMVLNGTSTTDIHNQERERLKGLAEKHNAQQAKPAKATATPRAILEETVSMADKRPPTHDLVKGIVLGVRYALGITDPSEFPKQWGAWVARVGGTSAGKKEPTKVAAKAKVAKAKASTKGVAKSRYGGKGKVTRKGTAKKKR